MADVVTISREECEAHIASALAELDTAGWLSWAARCHLHCSDFPATVAREALERLDAAAYLLHGGSYRDYAHVRPVGHSLAGTAEQGEAPHGTA